ncbi:hypothetical protein [Salinibacterium sp. ZJ450]|uniref:hypothetical protein n=1 Tax=Salinibacterium sp. ZJ450 TaxID=2708338 RepID=UPI00141EC773|nr:hypothetical protein [Salinibacterium sp. ZJ450]
MVEQSGGVLDDAANASNTEAPRLSTKSKTPMPMRCSSAGGHEEGIAYGLEGLFAVEVEAGAFERAGRFLGAADDTRERKGLLGPGIFSYHQRVLGQVEASPAAEEFTIAREQGRHADIAEVLEEALT